MNEKFILTLIDKFSEGSITGLNLSDGTIHLALRKGETPGTPGAAAPDAAGTERPVHLGLPGSAGNAVQGSGGKETITSPIVATFYASPGPDAPSFVKSGTRVKAGDTLCILEAMKMMNHLEAEFDCEILSVKAANGDLIEYGQVLFEVKRLRENNLD